MTQNTEFTFDTVSIRKNCDEFYSLYNDTHDGVQIMCTRKKEHTKEVAQNCLMIARKMGLDRYDRDMAWTIGLLHDFARFGQAVRTRTFVDSERFDHAKLGARLLFTHHLVDDIIPGYDMISSMDRRVMEKAVLHHSDYALPEDLTERERLFCVIIRDADKLDIFRTAVAYGHEIMYGCSLEEMQKDHISPEIEEAFYEHRAADYKKRVTNADHLMAHISLWFGLAEDVSRQRAKEQGYLQKLMDITFTDPAVQKKYLGMREQVENSGL